MSDKELIKQEIERLKNEQLSIFSKGESVEVCGTALDYISIYNQLLLFIDSIQEEPASKDLEEEIDNYFKDWTFDDEMSVMVKPNHYFAEFNDIKEIARHFAEWQKEKYNKQFGFFNLKDCKDAYNEWKSTQDEPSVALAWIRACEWQKQQMMKDAVEGEVFSEIKSISGSEFRVRSNRFKMNGIKMSDKVKIVILKTE